MPEVRLIDANALIKDIAESIRFADKWEIESHEKKDKHGLKCAIDTRRSLMAMISRIKEAPTIEPKRGEWVETEPDEDDRKIGIEFSIKCSRCHDENSHLDFNENHEITGKTFWKSRFCPNCGAYMREGGEQE